MTWVIDRHFVHPDWILFHYSHIDRHFVHPDWILFHYSQMLGGYGRRYISLRWHVSVATLMFGGQHDF